MHIRRPRRLLLRLRDHSLVDLGALLHGKIEAAGTVELVAISPATGLECSLENGELSLLKALSKDRWTPADEAELEPERLAALADCGVVITDEESAARRVTRDRDRAYDEHVWGEHAAALYGVSTVSPGAQQSSSQPISLAEATAGSAEAYRRFIDRHGAPLPAFHEIERRRDRLTLPAAASLTMPLDELLRRRRTIRTFDRARPLAIADLASLLHVVFGCHSTTEMAREVTLLQRTSPSGGSLHPVEAYPLLINVEGAAAGLYHYNAKAHALDLLHPLERSDAESLAVRALAGQSYAADAQVLTILTARWARSFWKYRHNDRAFLVVAMDAGHLGQTFYLACTALGLGPFFSGAIDVGTIVDTIGLELAEEGPLAVCGCGWPAYERASSLELTRTPYSTAV